MKTKKEKNRPQNPRKAFKKDERPSRGREKSDERPTRSRDRNEERPIRTRDRKEERPVRNFERKDERTKSALSTSKNEAPTRSSVKREQKRERELFIWGRRTLESYFSNLHEQDHVDGSQYTLHIIVDKSNKAPAQLKPIVESAKTLGIAVVAHTSMEGQWPLGESSDLNHQRVCLKIPEYPVSDMEEVTQFLQERVENSEHGCHGLVLDQIQDPRNFGAILRSAAFFGVKFVVYATDRQSDISGLVLKTSAGGAFSLMLVPVVNINRALVQLKEAGAWIVGTTLHEKSVNLSELPKDRNWVLVLGNEEKGLRNEVVKNCDYLAKIPGGMGGVDSLNVSVAAGISIHALQS